MISIEDFALSVAQVGSVKRALCRNCQGDRNCKIKGALREAGDSEEYQWCTDWYILQCRGCDAVFCQTISTDSESYRYFTDEDGGDARELQETIAYWPALSKRTRPEWANSLQFMFTQYDALDRPLSEVYDALDNDLVMLATIGVRTVFDIGSGLLGVEEHLPFVAKLTKLVELGKIGDVDKDHLTALVEAGNASAHRGWLPKIAELSVILEILESFISKSFIEPEKRKILDERAKKLIETVPKRKKPEAKQ